MKIFLLLFVSLFVFVYPAFPQKSLIAENNFKYFHAGVFFGESLMNQGITETKNNAYDLSISAYNNEIIYGGNAGAVFSWDFYKSEKMSHGLEFRASYNFFQRNDFETKSSFSSGGDVYSMSAEEKYNMDYIELNLLYHFLFANNHLGITLGPGYYNMLGINYKATWSSAKSYSKEVKLKTFSGFCGVIGIEYLLYYKNLVIIPNIKMSRKGYISEYDVNDNYQISSLTHYLFNVDIRYAF